MQKENNIFDSSGCLTDNALALYVKDRLAASDKALADKHLTSCEMCADALEGLRMALPVAADKAVNEIHAKIDALVEREAQRKRSTWLYAAAAIALILGIGSLFLLNYKQKAAEDNIALLEAEKTAPEEVQMPLADSVVTPPAAAPKENKTDKAAAATTKRTKQVAQEPATTTAMDEAEIVEYQQPEFAKDNAGNAAVKAESKEKEAEHADADKVEMVEYQQPTYAKDNTSNAVTITRKQIAAAPMRSFAAKPSQTSGTEKNESELVSERKAERYVNEMLAYLENNKEEDDESARTSRVSAYSKMKKNTRSDAAETSSDSFFSVPEV